MADCTQQDAFKRIRKAISSTPVLRFYSLEEEVTIQCDASKSELGAALLLNEQPVTYTSRALTDTEQRYSQIEKECLSIIFAVEKFNMCIYNRPTVIVQTDHQPLETIC